LKGFFDNGGPALGAAQQAFRRALNAAPPLLDEADHVFKDLGYNQQALSTLVSSTAQLSDAVAASNPGVRTLIDSAATTFGTVASNSQSLNLLLEQGKRSLYWLGTGLQTAGAETLPRLARVARRLSPGVTELQALAKPLDSTLQEVVTVEPTAVDTLDTVSTSGPVLNRFLADARTSLLPQLQSVAAQAAVELNCIRPYTPDAIAFTQGWGGFFGDGLVNPHVHFLHALVTAMPFPELTPLNSTQIHQIFPGLTTMFPAAPGMEWGQPWYLPQCDMSQSQLAVDSELGTYDPHGTKIAPFNSITPTYAPALHPN
jgi:hypothetical protein